MRSGLIYKTGFCHPLSPVSLSFRPGFFFLLLLLFLGMKEGKRVEREGGEGCDLKEGRIYGQTTEEGKEGTDGRKKGWKEGGKVKKKKLFLVVSLFPPPLPWIFLLLAPVAVFSVIAFRGQMNFWPDGRNLETAILCGDIGRALLGLDLDPHNKGQDSTALHNRPGLPPPSEDLSVMKKGRQLISFWSRKS